MLLRKNQRENQRENLAKGAATSNTPHRYWMGANPTGIKTRGKPIITHKGKKRTQV